MDEFEEWINSLIRNNLIKGVDLSELESARVLTEYAQVKKPDLFNPPFNFDEEFIKLCKKRNSKLSKLKEKLNVGK
jgi:hypothetical protein